ATPTTGRSSSPSSASTTPATPRPRSSTASSFPEAGVAESRDIFSVCNSIEELGGLAQWAHDIARLFTARGHHVHLIGITAPAAFRDYGTDLPYRTSRMLDFHLSIIKRPTGLRRLNLAAELRARWYERLMRRVGQQLTEIFRAARPGGVVIGG